MFRVLSDIINDKNTFALDDGLLKNVSARFNLSRPCWMLNCVRACCYWHPFRTDSMQYIPFATIPIHWPYFDGISNIETVWFTNGICSLSLSLTLSTSFNLKYALAHSSRCDNFFLLSFCCCCCKHFRSLICSHSNCIVYRQCVWCSASRSHMKYAN